MRWSVEVVVVSLVTHLDEHGFPGFVVAIAEEQICILEDASGMMCFAGRERIRVALTGQAIG